jgi:hypothetical protein
MGEPTVEAINKQHKSKMERLSADICGCFESILVTLRQIEQEVEGEEHKKIVENFNRCLIATTTIHLVQLNQRLIEILRTEREIELSMTQLPTVLPNVKTTKGRK